MIIITIRYDYGQVTNDLMRIKKKIKTGNFSSL